MKYFKTYEGFKKGYMKKIDLKDFKKIKKGSKIMYMGGEAEVLDNNGFVLKLKGKDGKTFTVNKSMFDHGGMIREGVMDNIHLMADASKDYDDFKKKFKKGFPKIFKSTPDFMDWLYGMYKDMAPDKVEEGWGKAPDADKAMRDLERKGSQIDWLDDADDATKKIWKKAGVNPEDENTVILYSYVSHQWDDAKKILKKHNVDFKELEDPNSAGESFIVFVKESINEAAYVPSNIEEFAKRRGVLRDVKQIARWAEKAGKRIVGGTAIGKGYDTLVLDLRHHGGEIYYDTYKGTIKVNGKPVDSWKTFSKAVEESVTEARFNKRKLMRAMKKDDGFIQLGNGQEYIIYNPNNNNSDNTDMWQDDVIFALDQDGEEHEIKYSDIVSYNESRKIDLRADHLSSEEYQKAKKLKAFDKKDWEWNSKSGLYDRVNEMSSEKDGTEASDGKRSHEDYLEEDVEKMWKKTYGENFASKYPGIAKILKQRKIKDPREIARIWQETYGEDFKKEYPAMWDMLSK